MSNITDISFQTDDQTTKQKNKQQQQHQQQFIVGLHTLWINHAVQL